MKSYLPTTYYIPHLPALTNSVVAKGENFKTDNRQPFASIVQNKSRKYNKTLSNLIPKT